MLRRSIIGVPDLGVFEELAVFQLAGGPFAGLQRDATPYVPAFFMAAQQLARLNRIDEARSALREGISAARQQNNGHAAGEMSEFLAGLGGLGE